jgi:hypothetical protein
MFKKILVLICSIFLLISCDQTYPDSFIIVKNATNMKHFYTGGINRMFYQVEAKFPAESTIQEISRKLESEGWIPLQEDYLHPGDSTSLVSGWTIYEDPPKRPAHMIYEWSANWKDKADNIVKYQFQYKDPIDKYKHGTVILKPASASLIVNAVYMPEKVAKNMRESINRKKKPS